MDDGLRYVAADGRGAADIVGTPLPPGAGIAPSIDRREEIRGL